MPEGLTISFPSMTSTWKPGRGGWASNKSLAVRGMGSLVFSGWVAGGSIAMASIETVPSCSNGYAKYATIPSPSAIESAAFGASRPAPKA
ncbi:hypothetical protein GCM10009850_000200 [Nonomuraea monospora]|uniref:Uncharacterized protein n=1 Tax=Nonomuraea monospora TaxID=568818 RepID=A0ABP5NWP0_9ACTN